jgi:glycerophosphoryl diester phosphodiesterase
MTPSYFDTMPRIIGHRGACGHAPENTIASFRKAAELGARSVEIDVTVTQDGQPVIHHDMNVRRCTNGSGPVLLKSLRELQSLDAGSWFGPAFAGEKIPTLAEAIDCIGSLDMSLNLEIKPCAGWQAPTAEIVGKELQNLDPALPILLSSFDIEALMLAGDQAPHLPRGYLTEAIPPDWEHRLHAAAAASLHCHRDFVTEDLPGRVRAAGFKLLVYTVNDVEQARQFLDWGVDALITDLPDRLLTL